jgi:hypothetical protein
MAEAEAGFRWRGGRSDGGAGAVADAAAPFPPPVAAPSPARVLRTGRTGGGGI